MKSVLNAFLSAHCIFLIWKFFQILNEISFLVINEAEDIYFQYMPTKWSTGVDLQMRCQEICKECMLSRHWCSLKPQICKSKDIHHFTNAVMEYKCTSCWMFSMDCMARNKSYNFCNYYLDILVHCMHLWNWNMIIQRCCVYWRIQKCLWPKDWAGWLNKNVKLHSQSTYRLE